MMGMRGKRAAALNLLQVVLPVPSMGIRVNGHFWGLAVPICFRLLMQEMPRAFSLAIERAGRSMAARTAMIAMTTSSSISVKPSVNDEWGDTWRVLTTPRFGAAGHDWCPPGADRKG